MTVLEDAHDLLRWGRTNRAIALLRATQPESHQMSRVLAHALHWAGRTDEALLVAASVTECRALAEELRIANGIRPQGDLQSHWLQGLQALVQIGPSAAYDHFLHGVPDHEELWWNRCSMALCLAIDGVFRGEEDQLDVYLDLVADGPEVHPGRTKPDRHLLLRFTQRLSDLRAVESEVVALVERGMKTAESDTAVRAACMDPDADPDAGLRETLNGQTDQCVVKRLWVGPAQQRWLDRMA
jgi:hypothetical protein